MHRVQCVVPEFKQRMEDIKGFSSLSETFSFLARAEADSSYQEFMPDGDKCSIVWKERMHKRVRPNRVTEGITPFILATYTGDSHYVSHALQTLRGEARREALEFCREDEEYLDLFTPQELES